MGKIDKRISIVLNMSEDKLRKLIREEVHRCLNETLDKEAEKAMETIKGIPVTLGNPSAASRIPVVPFPEIKAEDVRRRIEELDGGTYHYGRSIEEDEGADPGEEETPPILSKRWFPSITKALEKQVDDSGEDEA